MVSDDVRITVLHEWNGWSQAFVRLSDLRGLHLFQPSGAPKPLMHGYVLCTDLTGDEFPHDCERTAAPHSLLVCILKSHSTERVYTEIMRRAEIGQGIDPRPALGARPPSGDGG